MPDVSGHGHAIFPAGVFQNPMVKLVSVVRDKNDPLSLVRVVGGRVPMISGRDIGSILSKVFNPAHELLKTVSDGLSTFKRDQIDFYSLKKFIFKGQEAIRGRLMGS